MTAPPRFLGNVYDAHSDNDIDNEVFLQVAGLSYSDRHVLIWRLNASTSDSTSLAAQVIQLSGQAGNYSYYAPVVLSTAVTHTHIEPTNLPGVVRSGRRRLSDRRL